MNLYSEYEIDAMKDTLPVLWNKCDGSLVWSKYRQYIDFTCGIFVSNLGHCENKRQYDINNYHHPYFAFAYPTNVRKEFVDTLMNCFPDYLNRVALFSEGGMATDKAIQIAREYTGKHMILSFKNSYHGSTSFWKEQYISGLQEVFPIKERKFNGNKYVPEDIAAIILEGYRGWDCRFFPKSYVKSLQEWCNKNNILLIIDEIQSGFGRTGKMFAFEHYDIKPDIVTVGKAISGSIPMSAVVGRKKIMEVFDGKELISNTHSGNTFCCFMSLLNIKEILETDWKEVKRLSTILFHKLYYMNNKYDIIKEITGKGMVAAIHFEDEEVPERIVKECEQKGLLVVRTRKNTIKIGPPINIYDLHLEKGLNILEECIDNENKRN